jgi:hypothetical protein
MLIKIFKILPKWNHGIRAKKVSFQNDSIVENPEQVKREIAEGDTSKPTMEDASPSHPSPEENQSSGPEGIGILYGKSGQRKANECHHHHQVDESVEDMKPPINFGFCFIRYHRFIPFLTIHEPS